jgi:hypothetical protein
MAKTFSWRKFYIAIAIAIMVGGPMSGQVVRTTEGL